jgi:hypothetical protein
VVAGQYRPVSEAVRGYDDRVDVESVCRITRSIPLFVAERCGGRGPLNFPAYLPTRTREIMTDLASSTFPERDTWRFRLLNYVDERATS